MPKIRCQLLALVLLGRLALPAARLRADAPSPPPSPADSVAPAATATPDHHPHIDASSPAPKADKGQFLAQHQAFLERAKQGPVDLLFLGDSITARWQLAPEIWNAHYQKYRPANFGISGDSTQNLLWRIDNGELDGIHPKVVVLLAGTNNTGTNTAQEIVAADTLLVQKIRAKLPQTKVLLLGIFPRGPRKSPAGVWDDGVQRKVKIGEVNPALAKLDNKDTVRYLDLGSQFLEPDGKIPDDVFPDQLHPSAKGYEIWAKAMQPLLDEMMASEPKPSQ